MNGVAYMAVKKNDSLALKKNLLNQTGHEIWGQRPGRYPIISLGFYYGEQSFVTPSYSENIFC